MRIAVFDTHPFEKPYLEAAARAHSHELSFLDVRLNENTACLAGGFPVVCAFVNDRLNVAVIQSLRDSGTKLIALRSAGFNHVDLAAANAAGLPVVRVPEYSPYAVAEHAVALLLSLNRRTHKAYARVREGNFSLDGLVGFDLHGKTAGIVGTGRIGSILARILHGFGCDLLAFDIEPKPALTRQYGVRYVDLQTLLRESDIVSLHVPLTPKTRHLIDDAAFREMKAGAALINTGRGALIDTRALIQALKSGHLGFAGLDVYEEEENVFFRDFSGQIIQDDTLARLLTFPNVLITSHQAFLTREALTRIAETTLESVTDFSLGRPLRNQVLAER